MPDGINPVDLEARLGSIEKSIEVGFTGVNGKIDVLTLELSRLNGQVSRNKDDLTKNDRWQQRHETYHATSTNIRRRDWVTLGVVVTAAGTIAGVIAVILSVIQNGGAP